MGDSTPRGGSHWLGFLLVLALVRGFLYLALIPPWQGPDETGHFEYAWLIASLRRLPTRDDTSPEFERELLGSLYEWKYGEFIGRPLPDIMPFRMEDLPSQIYAQRSRTILNERFSLSYLWQALFVLPFRFQDLGVQLLIARVSSVVLNAGIVYLAAKTFSLLVKSQSRLVWLMTAVIVLNPQHTFVNSMVGDGPLAEFMTCLVILCWVQLLCREGNPLPILGVVVGTVGALWSKASTAFLIPVDIGLAFWWLLRRPARAQARQRALYLGAFVALLGIAVVALAYLPSPYDVGRLSTRWGSLHLGDLSWIDERGIGLGQALLITHDSFWANFGWMALPVSSRWYGALLLLAAAAVLGWLLPRRLKWLSVSWAPTAMAVFLVAALIVFVWGALLPNSSGFYQFQGRYLFPVVVPSAFLMVSGWRQWVPLRREKALAWTAVLFLVLFDAWCVLGYIMPYFHSQ